VRYQSPVVQMCRTALADTEIGEVAIKKGDYLVMVYEAANRDEDVWDRADELDVERTTDTTHLAFGFAEHFCLGANLARRTARLVLGELLERFPDYEVVGEVEWYRTVITPNPSVLPVVLK
jgi:cytochrome P450